MISRDDEPLAGRDPDDGDDDADDVPEPAATLGSTAARLLRFGAPALAAFVLVLVVVGDATHVDSDLQLIVPAEVLPGSELPLRALLYDELHGIMGPKLLAPDVDIELRDQHTKLLAHTRLHAANGGMAGVEGGIRLPTGYQGPALVIARAQLGDRQLRVESPVRIVPDARGVVSEERELRALQLLSEGPLRAVANAVAPSALHVRVAGGACVPEQVCSLLVHVGEPAAAVAIEPGPAVSLAARVAKPPVETSGVVQLDVVTHGPEAELSLVASRAGIPVARRSLRLPVALGALSLSIEPRLLAPGQLPLLASQAAAADGCVVDLFRLDAPERMHWVRTGSLGQHAAPKAWPLGPLAPGIYRIQARRDAFSSKTAAVGVIYVRAASEAPSEVLGVLASYVSAFGRADGMVAAVKAAPQAYSGSELDATLRYLVALLESDLVVYPPAVTSFWQSVEQLRESQTQARAFAILALVLGGVALALSVGQRGLVASQRASAILVDAGQDQAGQRRARMRSLLAVIASALALLLVFVVLGLYVMARGFLR